MHQRKKGRWLKHLDFMMLDVAVVEIVFQVICHFRMRMMGWRYTPVYRSTQIVLLMLAFFVVALLPLHKNILKRGPLHELGESLRYISILAVGIMLYHFLTKSGTSFSRAVRPSALRRRRSVGRSALRGGARACCPAWNCLAR